MTVIRTLTRAYVLDDDGHKVADGSYEDMARLAHQLEGLEDIMGVRPS